MEIKHPIHCKSVHEKSQIPETEDNNTLWKDILKKTSTLIRIVLIKPHFFFYSYQQGFCVKSFERKKRFKVLLGRREKYSNRKRYGNFYNISPFKIFDKPDRLTKYQGRTLKRYFKFRLFPENPKRRKINGITILQIHGKVIDLTNYVRQNNQNSARLRHL